MKRTLKKFKELSKTLTDDWSKSELRARKFEQLYEDGKILHKIEVAKLNEAFAKREQEFIAEKNDMNAQFDSYRK